MIDISISEDLKKICPNVTLGCIQANVCLYKHNEELWNEINKVCIELKKKITLQDISKLPNNKESREAYKKLGKDPSRYRVSSEALLRRILKENKLYQVNNIVDINNLISITSYYSVGCYDVDKLNHPVIFTIGKKGEPYEGIGRGSINIEKLPVLYDTVGPFGSATSDSERTMVTMETNRIFMNIISFNGKKSYKSIWIVV
jgi:DNA/RNA-binding domain of Phe-tRNA-synthetase-like protein